MHSLLILRTRQIRNAVSERDKQDRVNTQGHDSPERQDRRRADLCELDDFLKSVASNLNV